MAFLTKLPHPYHRLKGSARYHSSTLTGSGDAEIYIIQYFSSPSPTQLAAHLQYVRLRTHEPEPSHCTRDHRCPSQENGWLTDVVQVSKELSALPAANTWRPASPSGNSDLGLAKPSALEEPLPSLQPLQEPTETGLQAERRLSTHPQNTQRRAEVLHNRCMHCTAAGPSSPVAWRVPSQISNGKDAPEACCTALTNFHLHYQHP